MNCRHIKVYTEHLKELKNIEMNKDVSKNNFLKSNENVKQISKPNGLVLAKIKRYNSKNV